MHLLELKNFPSAQEFEAMGLSWHAQGPVAAGGAASGQEGAASDYIASELVAVSAAEAEGFYQAAERCYELFCAGAEHAIENELFFELGIPFNLVELIKCSWENDVFWHIYGRFDFAGGLDGAPIRLLEFNANTPTALFESAFVQYELLRRDGRQAPDAQFNTAYEALISNFKRVVYGADAAPEQLAAPLDIPQKMLFCSVRDAEEELTTRFLMQAAREAGWQAEFAYIDEAEFAAEGLFFAGERYEFLFSLLPWEVIATEEPELCNLLTALCTQRLLVALNPPYTLLFQSKGMLALLAELFPDEELLLPASLQPLEGCAQVAKPFFGREGANVTIRNASGEICAQKDGDFADGKFVYQQRAELNRLGDEYYQAGVFYAYEPCALGFRRGEAILDNRSQFVGHYLEH